MDDAAKHYISTLLEYRNAISKLDDYSNTLRNVAHQLATSRDNFAITNTGIGLPIAPRNTINGDEFPDAKAVQAALKAYHDAKRELMNAWQAVPDDLKGGLQQPPFSVPNGRGSRY